MSGLIEKGPTGRIKRLRELLARMTRDDVLNVLQRFSPDEAARYGYADSTDYDLLFEGQRFPPKAVLGLSAARIFGRPLTSDEFAGGLRSPCFVVLKSLGFTVVVKDVALPLDLSDLVFERFHLYDRREISQIFEPGVSFTSGAGRWGIQGIVETPKESGNFVFMVTLGKPVEGNPYQDALTEDGCLLWESQTQHDFDSDAIRRLLAHDPQARSVHLFLRPKKTEKYTYIGLLEYFSHDPKKTNPVHFIWRVLNWDLNSKDLAAMGIPVRDPLDPAFSPPPPVSVKQGLVRVQQPEGTQMPPARQHRSPANKALIIDWAERDARNRQLGLQGEKLVLRYEIDALRSAGRENLANQVRHLALYDGAAGYDIQSFSLDDGRPKRIEVKTTQGPVSTPFFISLNEVLASRDNPDSYAIYRVFDHRNGTDSVKFFELAGEVEESCGLVPTNFRAYPGGKP